MPSIQRRTVLTSLGAVTLGSLAGCSALQSEPPAGSLRFDNNDTLPHSITLRVTSVGSEPGDEPGTTQGNTTTPPDQRNLTASTTVPPGESQTYEEVFTEPVWYGVQFTADGQEPANDNGIATYHPAPDDSDTGRILAGVISESGEFSWRISSTENLGNFSN